MEYRRIFLSGPMTGYPNFNAAVFNARAAALRAQGLEVWNPAEIKGGDTTYPRHIYQRHNLYELTRYSGAVGQGLYYDALAVLAGWQDSVGARMEVQMACELELPVLDAVTMCRLDPKAIVNGLIYAPKGAAL